MKAKIGTALLLVASVLIFVAAGQQTLTNNILAALAVVGLAAGALLSGLSGADGRPV